MIFGQDDLLIRIGAAREFHCGHETGIVVVGVEGEDIAFGQSRDAPRGERLGHDQKRVAVEGEGSVAEAALAAVVPVTRRRRRCGNQHPPRNRCGAAKPRSHAALVN